MKKIKIRAKGTVIVEREFFIEIDDDDSIFDYTTELEDEFDNLENGEILDFNITLPFVFLNQLIALMPIDISQDVGFGNGALIPIR